MHLHDSKLVSIFQAYFRAFGHVVDCSVVRDKDSGISRGFAFLTFLTEEEADTAVDLENHKLDGKPIRVSYAQKNASSIPRASKKTSEMKMDDVVLPNQTRIYLGTFIEIILITIYLRNN